jgi:hypothetical protein
VTRSTPTAFASRRPVHCARQGTPTRDDTASRAACRRLMASAPADYARLRIGSNQVADSVQIQRLCAEELMRFLIAVGAVILKIRLEMTVAPGALRYMISPIRVQVRPRTFFSESTAMMLGRTLDQTSLEHSGRPPARARWLPRRRSVVASPRGEGPRPPHAPGPAAGSTAGWARPAAYPSPRPKSRRSRMTWCTGSARWDESGRVIARRSAPAPDLPPSARVIPAIIAPLRSPSARSRPHALR